MWSGSLGLTHDAGVYGCGSQIQMKVKRTTEDKEEEKRRQKYLKKLNAVVGAEFVDDD
jgi:hypothetical protein